MTQNRPHDSISDLPPVFIETLLITEPDAVYPVTCLDPDRWRNDNVFVLGKGGFVNVISTMTFDGALSDGDIEIDPDQQGERGEMIIIAPTQNDLDAAIAQFEGSQILRVPNEILLGKYIPANLLEAQIPDICLIVDGAPQMISGLEAVDRMTRVYRALLEHAQQNSRVKGDGADIGPPTLDDAQLRHIEEVTSAIPWIQGITIVSTAVAGISSIGNRANAIFFVVDTPTKERYEEIVQLTNTLQNDLRLQALGYAFDPRVHPEAHPELELRQKSPQANGLREPDPRELDENGFGPHALTDHAVDQLNEILSHHHWVLSARVVSKEVEGVERAALIVGAHMNPDSPLAKSRFKQLAREIKPGVEGMNLIGTGQDVAIGKSKTVPYSTRWLDR